MAGTCGALGAPNLPPVAMTHVLPSLCRTALEHAFSEAAWLRLHRAGLAEHEAEKTVAGPSR